MRGAIAIRWVARVWGTSILAFVLFFLIADIFGEQTDEGLRGFREIITFLLFPVSTIAGLGIALRWEGVGGAISTLSIMGVFMLRPDLVNSPWFILLGTTKSRAPSGVDLIR